MCKVKVKINMEIFDDEVGNNCQNRNYEPIRVYSDSDDVCSALMSAIYETLIVLEQNGHKIPPKMGVRSHQKTESILARRARKLFLYQNDSDSDKD